MKFQNQTLKYSTGKLEVYNCYVAQYLSSLYDIGRILSYKLSYNSDPHGVLLKLIAILIYIIILKVLYGMFCIYFVKLFNKVLTKLQFLISIAKR